MIFCLSIPLCMMNIMVYTLCEGIYLASQLTSKKTRRHEIPWSHFTVHKGGSLRCAELREKEGHGTLGHLVLNLRSFYQAKGSSYTTRGKKHDS